MKNFFLKTVAMFLTGIAVTVSMIFVGVIIHLWWQMFLVGWRVVQ